MYYKNVSFSVKTFYGVTFKPGEIKEVNSYINNKFLVPATPEEVKAQNNDIKVLEEEASHQQKAKQQKPSSEKSKKSEEKKESEELPVAEELLDSDKLDS